MQNNKASAARIRDFLPQKSDSGERIVFPQTDISSDIFERTKKQKIKDGLTWEELLNACFNKYLEESKAK